MSKFQRIKAALRRRRKLLLILALMLAVAFGPYLVSRLRSRGRRVRIAELSDVEANGKSRGETLRVLTYNIAHGRGPIDDNWEEGGDAKRERIARIAKLIADAGPDVVVLNEVDFDALWSGGQNQAEAIAKRAGYRYRVEQRNLDFRFAYGSWKFGNAVLSRFPIVSAEVVNFPAPAAWEDWLAGRKRGVVCTLQLPNDRRVKIAAVHLETRDAVTRVRSALLLLELAKGTEPVILAGDFNSTPAGFPFHESPPPEIGEWNAIQLVNRNGFQVRPAADPAAKDFTYPARQPDRVIDWIAVPAAWRFVEYRVLDTRLSDHRPVLATLQMGER